MTEQLTTGINLMVIGMITVFVVLFLVVWGGKLLIFFANTFLAPPHEIKPEASDLPTPDTSINHKHLAVLSAVVEHITEGKGRINKIEKM